MAYCSRCGQPVEFRYIDGRCIPFHPFGGCSSDGCCSVRDYSGYSHSEESTCFRTSCPKCDQSVFFLRYNGGGVWIDPPLGPPWYKHPCMDANKSCENGTRSVLITKETLIDHSQPNGLIVGVAKESETAFDGSFTLLNIESGEAENFYLLIKNKAGFLVGRMVLYDPTGATVKWVDDQQYSFAVLATLRVPKRFQHLQDEMVPCPECERRMKAKNLGKHLRREHGYITL